MPVNIPIGPVQLSIGDSTDSDVLAAIANNTPFPDRELQLGRISASFSAPLTLAPGAGASVSLDFKAGGSSGILISKDPTQILSVLTLDPNITLSFGPSTTAQLGLNDRLICFSLAANVTGSVNGTSPIGVVGSATFGISSQDDTCFAIVHRFDLGDGARDVLQAFTESVKTPYQVGAAADLTPATWIVAEADGSLTTTLSAKLGYTLIKTDDLQWLGTSHSVGAKIDASLTASLGFDVSGKYLVALSRPSSDAGSQNLHLQLFKQVKDGWNIGLALTAGIQADPELPGSMDDFISGVFGIYGPQIVNDLQSIAKWTQADLGDNVAALTTQTATDLLESVTKLALPGQLAQAMGILQDALSQWNNLSENGSAEIQALAWKIMGNPGDQTRQALEGFLTSLSQASTAQDSQAFTQAFSDAMQNVESREWLLGIADGLGSASGLALIQSMPQVGEYAQNILNVLTGNTGNLFDQLKNYIAGKFDLSDISKGNLSDWAQQRLAKFLDQTVLSSTDITNIKNAISALESKASDLYDKVKSAINTRYSFDFSTKYERNDVDSALMDVLFDCGQPDAQALCHSVLTTSGTSLFDNKNTPDLAPVPGVTINEAVLTHEIHTSCTTHVGFLSFSSTSQNLNDTVANLTLEQNGARLVAYVNSKDQASATNRYASILQLQDALTVNGTTTALPSVGTVSYEMRMIGQAMSQATLEYDTSDFATTYLSDKFPSTSVYENNFLKSLDVAVSGASANPALPLDNFGDVALSLQVSLSSDVLAGWLVARDADTLKSDSAYVSRSIQEFIRRYTVLLYFQDVNQFNNISPAAAVLLWASLPLCAGTQWDPSSGTLTKINTNDDVYWANDDAGLVSAMVNHPQTTQNLQTLLGSVVARLAGTGVDSSTYSGPGAAGVIRTLVMGDGSTLTPPQAFNSFSSLLTDERTIVYGAASALSNASAVAADLQNPDRRSDARNVIAQFGDDLTTALNSGFANLYTGDLLHLYAPLLLVELAPLLAPGSESGIVSAMMQFFSLNQGHSFDLNSFLTGSAPNAKDIAVSQTIVSTGLGL